MSSSEIDDTLQQLDRKDVPGSIVDGTFTGEGKVPTTETARQKMRSGQFQFGGGRSLPRVTAFTAARNCQKIECANRRSWLSSGWVEVFPISWLAIISSALTIAEWSQALPPCAAHELNNCWATAVLGNERPSARALSM